MDSDTMKCPNCNCDCGERHKFCCECGQRLASEETLCRDLQKSRHHGRVMSDPAPSSVPPMSTESTSNDTITTTESARKGNTTEKVFENDWEMVQNNEGIRRAGTQQTGLEAVRHETFTKTRQAELQKETDKSGSSVEPEMEPDSASTVPSEAGEDVAENSEPCQTSADKARNGSPVEEDEMKLLVSGKDRRAPAEAEDIDHAAANESKGAIQEAAHSGSSVDPEMDPDSDPSVQSEREKDVTKSREACQTATGKHRDRAAPGEEEGLKNSYDKAEDNISAKDERLQTETRDIKYAASDENKEVVLMM
ncbi:sodium/potassium/calcium exchanger 1 isoform X2 [Amia ocellicauda]|uniref:sodium/potassium/calcium exchanger 1 isoform X2 n=1 Tax=Amia ocellicauda TaxID=2972642 RepID=UPI0034647DE0